MASIPYYSWGLAVGGGEGLGRLNAVARRQNIHLLKMGPKIDSVEAVKSRATTGPESGTESIFVTRKSDSSKYTSVLLLVPLVWGSYSPLVKNMYSNTELPPPAVLFNLMSYFVSFACLSLAGLYSSSKSKEPQLDSDSDSDSADDSSVNTMGLGVTTTELRAGIELGLYLYGGSTLQVMGIQQTTATKAAILVQCTTVIVPVLDSILNKRAISSRVWAACFLALIGVILVGVENPLSVFEENGQVGSVLGTGDALICTATLFYSMHVVRLGRFAKEVSAISLARVKSGTELLVSAGVITLILEFGREASQGQELSDYVAFALQDPLGPSQSLVAFSVVWNGALATALTTWAQTFGQSAVSPTQANILYSSQPIWAAAFSYAFLGESLSTSSLAGVLVLASAILLASTTSSGEEEM